MNKVIAYLLLNLVWIPAVALAHPLHGALKGLSKVAGEVKSLNATDPTTKHLSEALLAQVEKAWLMALHMPVEAPSKRMEQLGISLVENKKVSFAYIIKHDDAGYLKNSAYNLESTPWLELRESVQEQLDQTEKIIATLKDPSVTQNISGRTESLGYRIDDKEYYLKELLEYSNNGLSCIEHVTKGQQALKVRTVGTGQSLQWSAEDLRSNYGVSDVSELKGEEKARFLANFDLLLKPFSGIYRICIPREKLLFLLNENQRFKSFRK